MTPTNRKHDSTMGFCDKRRSHRRESSKSLCCAGKHSPCKCKVVFDFPPSRSTRVSLPSHPPPPTPPPRSLQQILASLSHLPFLSLLHPPETPELNTLPALWLVIILYYGFFWPGSDRAWCLFHTHLPPLYFHDVVSLLQVPALPFTPFSPQWEVSCVADPPLPTQ